MLEWLQNEIQSTPTKNAGVYKACKTIVFKLNIQIQDIIIPFIIVVALSPFLFTNQHGVYRVSQYASLCK